jgi:hypothetical protein
VDEISLFAELRPDPPVRAGGTITAVRERLTAEMLLRPQPRPRSRLRLRSRRRIVLAAGALAAAAAAVIVVPAVLPASAPDPVVTKAWAVTEQPGGTVTVSVSSVRPFKPAELEAALKSAGVAAIVRGGPAYSCVGSNAPMAPESVQRAVVTAVPDIRSGWEWTIRPGAMPAGSILFIAESLSKAVSVVGSPVVLYPRQRAGCLRPVVVNKAR